MRLSVKVRRNESKSELVPNDVDVARTVVSALSS